MMAAGAAAAVSAARNRKAAVFSCTTSLRSEYLLPLGSAEREIIAQRTCGLINGYRRQFVTRRVKERKQLTAYRRLDENCRCVLVHKFRGPSGDASHSSAMQIDPADSHIEIATVEIPIDHVWA